MPIRPVLASLLCLAAFGGYAQASLRAPDRIGSPFSLDIAAVGLVPLTWAPDSPALSHSGFEARLGLEYGSPISVPIRLELGYIGVAHSRISATGELYRAWEGARLAILTGYSFRPAPIGTLGKLRVSVLGGGALSAAVYKGTALAYAYPSLLLEPRATLAIGREAAVGPWIALPIELMFRSGARTISPGLGLGWRWGLGGSK
jgi:hypothetical protein